MTRTIEPTQNQSSAPAATEMRPQDPEPRPGRAITWRSVVLGSLGVCLVCGLAPYNDFVAANTFLIGGYLPLAVVLVLFVLVVLVNAPLHRLAPSRVLSSGELAVILMMMLASCAIPTQGMLRFWLPMLAAPFRFGKTEPRFWNAFLDLHLPSWLLPVSDQAAGRSDPVIAYFYARVPEDGTIPYRAWIAPILGWGTFLVAWAATLLAVAVLFVRQWAVNERLPFPLAQLQLSLIQPPRPGRMLNDLFRSRTFWIAAGAVFVIQSSLALRQYWPKLIPEIPLTFDLNRIMSEEPWRHFHYGIKRATIFFTFVGVTYFVQSRIGFSLWATFLLVQVFTVQQKMMGSEITAAAWEDQHLGSAVAFLLGILWVGRHHWRAVLRQTVLGCSAKDRRQGFPSYRLPFLIAVAGTAVMLTWLMLLGVQLWMALLIVGMGLLAHIVTTRIVAETGFPFIRFMAQPSQVFTALPASAMSGRDVFFASTTQTLGPWATRESMLTYVMHGLRIRQSVEPAPRHHRGAAALIVWTLLLGFVVAVWSSLTCYYTYATPLGHSADPVINPHGLEYKPKDALVDPLARHAEGRFSPKTHSPFLHMGIGAAVTGLLHAASLRWASWPFMPVGYLISATWYIQVAWFSILLGWLAKVLILRFGGAKLFQDAKPLFIGLILGEALAAGIWLTINLILAATGCDYRSVSFLPT